jgi:hypothetical protein
MMTHDEMIAVIAHHKNGGNVQGKGINTDKWSDIEDPLWEFSISDYRIKPEPLVLWAAFYPDGGLQAVRTSESALIKFFGNDLSETTIKKFVEVTE